MSADMQDKFNDYFQGPQRGVIQVERPERKDWIAWNWRTNFVGPEARATAGRRNVQRERDRAQNLVPVMFYDAIRSA